MTCVSVRVFWSKCSDPLLFSQGSAAPTLLFLWAGQGSSLAAFRKGSAAFLAFSGQQASRRCQVGGRHLPIVSYGHSYKQTYSDTSFSESMVFAHLDRIVSLHILSGRLSSNSCSAVISRVLCYAKNSLFCFRPFPEVTLLARRR